MNINVPVYSVPFRFSLRTLPAWSAFRPGDHVRVWRGFYWHHAIYVGNGLLIEFGSGVFGGIVAYVSWEKFAGSRTIALVQHGGLAAINRAEGRLGCGGFDVLSSNCEHFATWCATGRWKSSQADILKFAATASLLLIVLNSAA